MKTYTLTAAEAAMYDSTDERINRDLFASLAERFGSMSASDGPTTEVCHPDGTLILVYASKTE